MRNYLVAMLFLMIVLPALPPGASTGGFPGGSDEAVLVLSAPAFESSVNLSVPADLHYLDATFNVTGLPAAGDDTAYPGDLSITLGDDSVWAFNGTGYGPLGRQRVFSDGTSGARARFGTGGGTSAMSLRLPMNATVRSATATVLASPAREWKEAQNFTLVPEPGYPVPADCAGDVNGDGFDDIVIGSAGDDSAGTDAGRAYVNFGGAAMNATPDVTFTGAKPGDRLGWDVSGAGDVNQDGFDDVLVSAIYNDSGGDNAGRAYIYLGGPAMDPIADVNLTGEAECDFFGIDVSPAGDVNSDGYDDVVIGACDNDAGLVNAGRAYVYFGGAGMDNVSDVVITGAPTDGLGAHVAGAGDVNRDGYDDVVVAAPGSEAPYENTGRAYVFLGGPGMDNVPDVTFNGTGLWDQFGVDVCGAGDLNGDGYDDVAVGADDWNSSYAGRVEVFFGGRQMDNRADLVVKGDGMLDGVGWSVSSGGDVNLDGFDDLLFGAEGNDSGAPSGGRAYILLGGAGMDARWDEAFTGYKTSEWLGRPVSDAGDVNGDGFGDILFGGNWGRLYLYSRLPGTGPGPLDPAVSLGGTPVWAKSGNFNGTAPTTDFATSLNGYLQAAAASGKDGYGNSYVDVPFCVSAKGAGEVALLDLAVEYDHAARVPDFSTLLNSYLAAHAGEEGADGNITVPLSVRSGSAGRVRLSDLELGPDLPPVQVLDIGPLEILEDTSEPRLLDLYTVFDDEADPDAALQFSLVSATNSSIVSVAISENRYLSVDALTGDANDNWTGTAEASVACTDSRGLSTSSRPFTINVQNVNDQPVITSSPALVAEPGVAYSYAVVSAHGDAGPLTYVLTKSPADMTIDPLNGTISWLPRGRGVFQVNVAVNDGEAAAEQKFALAVPNRPPAVAEIPPLNASVGVPISLNVTATDPNLDALAFSLLKAPQGMEMQPMTGALTWTPAAAGDFEVTVLAWDGSDGSYVNFTVKVRPVNRPPEILKKSGPDNSTVKSSTALKFSVEATDADGDSLTYEWRENGLTLGAGPSLTRKFPPGNHSLVLLIGDGHHFTSTTYDFTVLPSGPAPGPAVRMDNPGMAGAAIAAMAVAGLLLTASTEAGRYRWLVLFLPLYTRLRKENVLDHGTREFIRGSVYADPGIHYNEILRKLKLARGTAAYHLHTLEREGFIRSRSDGRLRRFYPAEMKLTDLPPRLDKLQRIIVETVRESEGLGQREIARILGLPSSTVNRQINRLCEMGVLRLEREGMTTRCYPTNGGNGNGHAADQPEPPAV